MASLLTFIRCEGRRHIGRYTTSSSTLLPSAAMEDISVGQDKKKSVYMVSDVDFRNLLEAHEDVARDSLEGEVDLVQTSPLFNVRNKCSLDSSPNEILMPEDMSDFADFASQVMTAGTHGHVFCAYIQFHKWF